MSFAMYCASINTVVFCVIVFSWGVILGLPKDATQAFLSRCLSNLCKVDTINEDKDGMATCNLRCKQIYRQKKNK